MLNHAARLKEAIGEDRDVQIGTRGDPSSVRYADTGEPLSSTAQAVADSFDWSEATHLAWQETTQQPQRKAFRQRFQAADDRLQEIEAATSMTNAQQTTAINDIARIVRFALRAQRETIN